MSLLLEAKGGLTKYLPFRNEEAKIRGFIGAAPATAPASKIKAELNELVVRLNELARKHPFNILHKVKKYDPL